MIRQLDFAITKPEGCQASATAEEYLGPTLQTVDKENLEYSGRPWGRERVLRIAVVCGDRALTELDISGYQGAEGPTDTPKNNSALGLRIIGAQDSITNAVIAACVECPNFTTCQTSLETAGAIDQQG